MDQRRRYHPSHQGDPSRARAHHFGQLLLRRYQSKRPRSGDRHQPSGAERLSGENAGEEIEKSDVQWGR